MQDRVAQHNRDFAQSHGRWFEAIYKDKYEYMGEFDLMAIAFTLDLGFYYLGIVSQPFKMGMKALLVPPFSDPPSRPFFHFIRAYNRRFAQIARRRRRIGTIGKTNRGRRYLIPGFHSETDRCWARGESHGQMDLAGAHRRMAHLVQARVQSIRAGDSPRSKSALGEKMFAFQRDIYKSSRDANFTRQVEPMAAPDLCCRGLVWIGSGVRAAALWIG